MYTATRREANKRTPGQELREKIAVGAAASLSVSGVPVLSHTVAMVTAGTYLMDKAMSKSERVKFAKWYENMYNPEFTYSEMIKIRLDGSHSQDQAELAKIFNKSVEEIQKIGRNCTGYKLIPRNKKSYYIYVCIGKSPTDKRNVVIEETSSSDLTQHIGYYSAMLAMHERGVRVTRKADSILHLWVNKRNKKGEE